MITIKDNTETQYMRQAGTVAPQILMELKQPFQPGIKTADGSLSVHNGNTVAILYNRFEILTLSYGRGEQIE